ncbi:hypothetical protein KR222_006265 [Zaprionus bogoriensis]|nr:hypothetical protein KR222_006265 [Zaprionus bogoriensis]
MALDLKESITTESLFLPGLVQQVFAKYQRAEGNPLSTVERAQLLTDLTALLGEDLLERALRLIDEWFIIVYYSPDRLRTIVELGSKRNTAHVVRILPGINYCKCSYFQRCVLRLPAEEQELSQRPEASDCISFTCEHVLAQRLHQLLVDKPPREQTLTLEQFKYFHEDIYVD